MPRRKQRSYILTEGQLDDQRCAGVYHTTNELELRAFKVGRVPPVGEQGVPRLLVPGETVVLVLPQGSVGATLLNRHRRGSSRYREIVCSLVAGVTHGWQHSPVPPTFTPEACLAF